MKVKRLFGGTYLHIQGRRIRRVKIIVKAGDKLRLFFNPEDGDDFSSETSLEF
jgi:hypothetical protein